MLHMTDLRSTTETTFETFVAVGVNDFVKYLLSMFSTL